MSPGLASRATVAKPAAAAVVTGPPLSINWETAYWASGPRWTNDNSFGGYTDGEVVETWMNEMPGGGVLNRQGGTPIFTAVTANANGKPTVAFNNAVMDIPRAVLTQPWSVAVIGYHSGAANCSFAGATEPNATSTGIGLARNEIGAGVKLTHPVHATPAVMVARFDGQYSGYRVNARWDLPTAVSGNAGTNSTSYRRIGARTRALLDPLVGWIAFVGYYAGWLSNEDETALVNWSHDFYGTSL